ncbi:MAG: stage II sporulation protein M [Chloroflexota bacterium]
MVQTTAKGTPTTSTPVQPSVEGTAGSSSYNWRMMLGNALIITRREVVDSFRDWRIVAPILILTFVFPFLATFVAGQFFDFVVRYGADFALLADRSIPFLLMIVGFFPISVSLVIALETFVGEKERRSLEPLLSTPMTNTELYMGKTLAAIIPPLLASYGGMIFYMTLLIGGDLAWRPQPMLIVQIFVLTTIQALVMVTGSVVVSSQATTTRAANLLASFILIPMALLIQGESFIMFIAPDAESPYGIASLWLIAFGLLVVMVMFLRVGNTIFNREELLGRTVDEINLRNIIRGIWRNTVAIDDDLTPARNPIDWYRRGMPLAIRHLDAALYIVMVWFVIAFIGGMVVGNMPAFQFDVPTDVSSLQDNEGLSYFLDTDTQTRAMGFVVWNNLRVLLLALILGVFSFGVLSLIATPAVFVVLGYLFVQLVGSGFDMRIFFFGIFTHGIIEIPVIVLATASAFKLGSVITKPPRQQTVGAAWTSALGDTLKLWLGLVLPGLVLAAAIEAFITPRIIAALLGI